MSSEKAKEHCVQYNDRGIPLKPLHWMKCG